MTNFFEKIFEKFRKPELVEVDEETTQPTPIGEEDATKPLEPLPDMIAGGPAITSVLELPQLIAGCGHQTLPRIIERAEALFDQPIYGLVGGLHYAVTGSRGSWKGIGVHRYVGTGMMP